MSYSANVHGVINRNLFHHSNRLAKRIATMNLAAVTSTPDVTPVQTKSAKSWKQNFWQKVYTYKVIGPI
jgi:hypothetical protein